MKQKNSHVFLNSCAPPEIVNENLNRKISFSTQADIRLISRRNTLQPPKDPFSLNNDVKNKLNERSPT